MTYTVTEHCHVVEKEGRCRGGGGGAAAGAGGELRRPGPSGGVEPPDPRDLLALVRLAAGRGGEDDARRATAAGLADEQGRPTAAGREALADLRALLERAVRTARRAP